MKTLIIILLLLAFGGEAGAFDNWKAYQDGKVTGQIIYLVAEHSITITDGTNIFLSGSANFTMKATDTLTLIQKADGKLYEVCRSVN